MDILNIDLTFYLAFITLEYIRAAPILNQCILKAKSKQR